jgi:hypothetical protein
MGCTSEGGQCQGSVEGEGATRLKKLHIGREMRTSYHFSEILICAFAFAASKTNGPDSSGPCSDQVLDED